MNWKDLITGLPQLQYIKVETKDLLEIECVTLEKLDFYHVGSTLLDGTAFVGKLCALVSEMLSETWKQCGYMFSFLQNQLLTHHIHSRDTSFMSHSPAPLYWDLCPIPGIIKIGHCTGTFSFPKENWRLEEQEFGCVLLLMLILSFSHQRYSTRAPASCSTFKHCLISWMNSFEVL